MKTQAKIIFLLLFTIGGTEGWGQHNMLVSRNPPKGWTLDYDPGSTYSNGLLTWTVAFSKDGVKPCSGAVVNGQLVVPCNYYFVDLNGVYFLAYPQKPNNKDGSYFLMAADVYTDKGELLFSVDRGINWAIWIPELRKTIFLTRKNEALNINGSLACPIVDIDYCEYHQIIGNVIFRTRKGDWYTSSGEYIGNNTYASKLNVFKLDDGGAYIKTEDDGRYGIKIVNGQEIFAPKFEECNYLGEDMFSFRSNGYWGVKKRNGTTVISLERKYTNISYNRTEKTLTFKKEDGYSGECNTDGIQTRIMAPSLSTNTPNPTYSDNGKNPEPSLLYKGEYTITSEFGDAMVETLTIYENSLETTVGSFPYKSTTSSGQRVYAGDGLFGAYQTYYVTPKTFDVRLKTTMSSPYGTSDSWSTVKKGESYMPRQNNGNNVGGGTYNNSNQQQTSQPSQQSTTQQHRCGLCSGTGRMTDCDSSIPDYSGGKGKYCSECGKQVPTCHVHKTCTSCKGKGYW